MSDTLTPYASFQMLLFDRPAPFVLRVTINNPAQLNALTTVLHGELTRLWPVIDADAATRVVIITGAGRAFCAGGAIEDMPSEAPHDPLDQFCTGFRDARELVAGIINTAKPVISAINGPAIGAGLAIALLADIPIAAKDAKLFDGHLRIGVVPGDHAAMIWPLLCGLAKAKYHLLTNEPVTGEQAERMNLVALSVDADLLQHRALEVANKLAATAPNALRMSKYVLNHFLRQNQTIFDLSAALEMVNFGSGENREAMRAMAAKEAPTFGAAGIFPQRWKWSISGAVRIARRCARWRRRKRRRSARRASSASAASRPSRAGQFSKPCPSHSAARRRPGAPRAAPCSWPSSRDTSR